MRRHLPSRRWATILGATALIAALGAPAAFASDCDPLVRYTPGDSQGDTAAVAITSQALSADVEGWERVGWQAAADTTVTRVTLVRDGGTEHRTDGDLSDGAAEHVLEVRFCGTTHDGGDAETTGDAEEPQPTAATDTDAPSEVAQATLAAAVQEPAAPLASGALGLLAGLFVVAGAQRQRTREERR